MRKLTPFLALVLAASPALAQDFTDDQLATFLATIAANGCSMTEAEAEVALPAVGIDRDLSGEIAIHLLDRDLATLSDDYQSFTLSAELCP